MVGPQEDKKLLQGIDEGSDDGTDVEVNSDGDDIDSTEVISGPLEKMGCFGGIPTSYTLFTFLFS